MENESVEAVVVTGQMQDVILVDHDANPLRSVILYSDMRAQAEAEEVVSQLGKPQLRQWTGNDQGSDGLLAKLLWLARHEPDNLARSAHLMLGAADYVVLKMTGLALCDSTTASTTGLLDINTRTILDKSVFESLGLGPLIQKVPPIVSGGTPAGTLKAAAALGLQAGTPVYHGPGDAGAATLGAGCGEPGSVYAYLGTSGWVAFSAKDGGDPDQGVITLAHPRPGYFIQVAPLLTAGGNLDWVRDLFGTEDYDDIVDAALQVAASRVVYLPYLNGERSPFHDPDARGAFVGFSRNTTRNHFYRAVLEGIVYAYRHAMEALLDQTPSHLVMTGGGTRSKAFCQLFADITQTPVSIASGAEYIGLRGALLAVQVIIGERDRYVLLDDDRAMPPLLPDLTARDRYNRQYKQFRMLYPALKSIFTDMADMSSQDSSPNG